MWVPSRVLPNGSMGRDYFIITFERGGRNVRKHMPAILMCIAAYQGIHPQSTLHLAGPYPLLMSIY